MAGNWNSGGRNKKSLQELRLTGGYRPDRHGNMAKAPAPPVPACDWLPTADELARLGPEGKKFLEDAFVRHEFNFMAGRLLLVMAAELDYLTVLRQAIDKGGVVITGRRGAVRVNPACKEHLRGLRLIGQLAKQINL